MIQLPNGCTIRGLSVHPLNWKTVTASAKIDWYIHYYFRDPNHPEYRFGKLVVLKGMNKWKTAGERREVTQAIIDDELEKLKAGFNPILKQMVYEIEYEIEPYTPFIKALRQALEKLKVCDQTIGNIKSALTYIEKASNYLGYSKIEIQKIRRKNISFLLNICPKIKKHWSAQLYNHYRTYLMMLFRKLVELEAIESNPVNNDLPKQQEEINLRDLLTPKERDKVEEHFKTDKYYHRFIHIFFHSGARPVELLRLKINDVDLEGMFYKIKVRKKKRIVEERRPIKLIAVEYWKEILDEINDPGNDTYLFGKELMPSKVAGTRDYITKKWQREVKGTLGIQKDLYSLKHLNLDQTAAILDANAAAKQAGHQSPVITLKHYLINETERKNNELRAVNNSFSNGSG